MTVDEDATPVVVDLDAAFDDLEDSDAQLVYSVTGNSNPGLFAALSIQSGSLQLNFAANANGTGQLTVRATDTAGDFIETSFQVTVNPINDLPVASNDSSETDEDVSLVIPIATLLSNDSDVDGDSLTLLSFTQPASGTLVDQQNGTLLFTPDANFHGVDSFEYTISDGNGGQAAATVNLVIHSVNDLPVATDNAGGTLEDVSLTINVADLLSDDSDADGDTINFSGFGQPGHGTVVDHQDGTLSYTPAANYFGTDSFLYYIDDGQGGSDSASFVVTVTSVNDNPVALSDALETEEDQFLDFAKSTLLGNDTDVDGDSLSLSSFDQPANGVVTDQGGGILRYMPNPGFIGQDSFSYTVSDGNGGSDLASVMLTVTEINDTPTTSGLSDVSVLEDASPTAIDLFAAFDDAEDADSELSFSVVGNSNPDLFSDLSDR